MKKPSSNRHRHGQHGTPTYRAWSRMKERCYNPKDKDFPRCGGAGITVCKEWLSFPQFLATMGERPTGTGLARISTKRGFMPSNCRWASHTERADNRRDTVFLKAWGQCKSLSAWLKDPRCKIARHTLEYRIRKLNWPIEKALETPPQRKVVIIKKPVKGKTS